MENLIKGITFDIWDTILIDDSDEPKRAAKGLPTKTESRIIEVFEVAKKYKPISMEDARRAYQENLKEFEKIWHDDYVTLLVPERLKRLFNSLDINPGEDDLKKANKAWEEMEYEIAPDLAPGVVDALKKLAPNYKLAIISDAIVSPGRVLRKILDKYHILKFFKVFSFSDEVGASKPSKKVFEVTIGQLQLEPSEIVHIGDRPYNDIDGPKDAGLKAFLYDGLKKREITRYKPDAVFSDYAKLPELLSTL